MTENEIRKTIEIDASPEVVFKALTNIDDLTQWFPNNGIFEPKVGGKMHFEFLTDHKGENTCNTLDGKILEYVPNKKLSYTFVPSDKYMPDGIRVPPTTVTWNIEEIGKNKTRVTLIHSGFTKELDKMFKETTDGWNYFTARLVQYCKSKDNATKEMSEREIRKVIEIDASPEVIFKALTDPKELTNWFPDHALLEPKVGGKFKFSFYKDSKTSKKKHDMDFFPEGKVLEFIPHKKVSYTWQHKVVPDFPETIVTWELEPIGKNKTRIKLTHSGFTGKEGDMYKEHNEGWSYYINELISYCKK